MRLTILAAALALCCFHAQAQAPASRYALSIYSAQANNGDGLFETGSSTDGASDVGGYAVVRDRRAFNLVAGSNAIEVREVARYLDPSALSARIVDAGDAAIVSQRFDDATLSFDALVQRQIGHPVEIAGNSANPASTPISGTLLSSNGGLTVQLADGRVTTVTDYGPPISSLNPGSSRMGSKSESPFAKARELSLASIASRRCSSASAVRPARLSQQATL